MIAAAMCFERDIYKFAGAEADSQMTYWYKHADLCRSYTCERIHLPLSVLYSGGTRSLGGKTGKCFRMRVYSINLITGCMK